MARTQGDEMDALFRRPATPRRFVAYVVDVVVLVLVGIAIWVALGLAGLGNPPWEGEPTARTRLGAVAYDLGLTLVSAAYFVGCWHLAQQTVGMRLLGLRVERVEDRHQPSVGECVVRWLVLEGALSIAVVFVVSGDDPLSLLADWAGVLWAVAILVSVVRDPLRRGWHDRASGSIVVAER